MIKSSKINSGVDNMNMKKVLLVVANNLMHGTERYVVDLAIHLSKEKYLVTVAVPEKGPISDILQKNHINEFVYNNGKFNKFSFKGSINIFRNVWKNKYNVIHSNCGIIPNIIGKLVGVKFNVESKHGILMRDEVLYNLNVKEKFHEKVKEYFVDFFIAESENDKEKMIKYFGIKREKIKVIYNGIDLKNEKKEFGFDLSISGKNGDEILIGTIGRLTFQKGHDILIKSFSNVLKEFSQVKLIILGSGENESFLKKMVVENKIEERIIFENYKENFYDFLKNLDIFILTSRFEGVPYVLLESMMIGTPVISTVVGGIDNVLKDGYSALLVEKDNIDAISSALIRLIKNPGLRMELSRNAFAEVQKYSIEKMVKNVEDLYSENL